MRPNPGWLLPPPPSRVESSHNCWGSCFLAESVSEDSKQVTNPRGHQDSGVDMKYVASLWENGSLGNLEVDQQINPLGTRGSPDPPAVLITSYPCSLPRQPARPITTAPPPFKSSRPLALNSHRPYAKHQLEISSQSNYGHRRIRPSRRRLRAFHCGRPPCRQGHLGACLLATPQIPRPLAL